MSSFSSCIPFDPVLPGADLLGLDQHLGQTVELANRLGILYLELVDDALGLLGDTSPEGGRAA